MKKNKSDVVIVMGSDSDWTTVKSCAETLDDFGVKHEVHVMSAHRTPERASDFASKAAGKGIKVIIAAAGGAAHLAGILAAHTTLPVIGIPVKGGALNGMDSLLATLQMPAGIPVATVTLGSAGPVNAALLAIQMLAIKNQGLTRKLARHKTAMKNKVAKGNANVQADIKKRK